MYKNKGGLVTEPDPKNPLIRIPCEFPLPLTKHVLYGTGTYICTTYIPYLL